jgi:hypothetical protein
MEKEDICVRCDSPVRTDLECGMRLIPQGMTEHLFFCDAECLCLWVNQVLEE